MKILVLGGTGYIGNKVVRMLVDGSHELVCTKREHSDIAKFGDIENRIYWIGDSILEFDTIIDNYAFDMIINLVCNYGKNISSDYDVINANLVFPLKILVHAAERGIKNYITIGSGLPEDFNIYSFSKKEFESFGKFYAEKYNINFVNLNLEMFYGPDEPTDRFFPRIIKQMISGEMINITEGTQKRDIIYVDDVIKAISLVVNNIPNGYSSIDVGTGVSPTISEVVDYIWKETGRKSVINKGAIAMRKNEPDCIADTTMIAKIGKWNPVDWKTGMKRMILEMQGDQR